MLARIFTAAVAPVAKLLKDFALDSLLPYVVIYFSRLALGSGFKGF